MLIRKNYFFYSFIIFCSIAFFPSCAAILMDKHQTVQIITHDSTSQVSIITPSTKSEVSLIGDSLEVKLVRGHANEVVVSKEGSKPIHGVIAPALRPRLYKLVQPLNLFTPMVLGFFIDYLSPNTINYLDELDYDIRANQWEQRNDSAKRYIYSNGVLFSSYYKAFAMVDFNLDTAKFEKRKAKAAANPNIKFNSYYDNIDLSDLNKVPNPYSFPMTFTPEDHILYHKLTYTMNEQYQENGFLDTTNFFFSDLDNSLFIGCYLFQPIEYRITYKPKVSVKQYALSGLWFIQNGYGEILDTITLHASSGLFINTSAIIRTDLEAFNEDAFLNMALALEKTSAFQKHLYKQETPPSTSIIQLNAPKAIDNKQGVPQTSVRIGIGNRQANGVVIDESGYIVTTYSNIATRYLNTHEGLTVTTFDGKVLPAQVVRCNKSKNLALLKVDHTFNYAALLPDSAQYEVYDKVIVNCFSNDPNVPSTIKLGLTSAIRKHSTYKTIQLNLDFSEGNEGSPVFKESNQLIGLVIKDVFNPQNEGITYAMPAEEIMKGLNLEYR